MPIAKFRLDVSYTEYCAALAAVEGQETAFSLPAPLLKWVGEVKDTFKQIAEEAKLSLPDLLLLFRHKDVFKLMKAVAFSVKKIFLALTKLTSLLPLGLLRAFEAVEETGLVKKLKTGTVKLDEVLNKYPVLKRLAGPALAGLLLYMWLIMPFIGDLAFDFDMDYIIDAFTGRFTLTDLFLSADGLSSLALVLIGSVTTLNVPWVTSSLAAFLLSLSWSVAKRMHKTGIVQKLKPLLEFKKY